jgi:hypothetical protein
MTDFGELVMDRFGDRISPEPNSGCWLWTGAASSKPKPYGVVRQGRKNLRINIVLKQMLCLEGDVVRHRCGVSLCVNPAHLTSGTQLQNVRDMSPEQLSERSRKANAVRTPEQRSASAHKVWAARRRRND